jgi:hypothetical protein
MFSLLCENPRCLNQEPHTKVPESMKRKEIVLLIHLLFNLSRCKKRQEKGVPWLRLGSILGQVGFAFRRVEMALSFFVTKLPAISGLAAQAERLDALITGL